MSRSKKVKPLNFLSSFQKTVEHLTHFRVSDDVKGEQKGIGFRKLCSADLHIEFFFCKHETKQGKVESNPNIGPVPHYSTDNSSRGILLH